jgi:hypothetical protein
VQELLPLLSGFTVGVALSLVRPSLRAPVGVTLAVALGIFATFVTGEFETSWGFVLIDVPLVGLAAACGLVGTRYALRRLLRAG